MTPASKVFYRTEHAECRPFAFKGRADSKARTIRRNFEVFEPLDFIAEACLFTPCFGCTFCDQRKF